MWTSDSNDPVDRQAIQRWTGLLLPPELMGSHVGAERTHATGRVADLGLRLATALFAHAGIEWDLTAIDARAGRPRRLDGAAQASAPPAARRPWSTPTTRTRPWLHGIVAQDRSRAVYAVAG